MTIQNLTGQTLGQYELRELLGLGGMGAVYRAYQTTLKREVAIKVLSSTVAAEPGYIERFNREAETSAALEHAHIVPVYDYGTQRSISYVVMRLLTGGTLGERFTQRAGTQRPLPSLGEIADLLKQVGSALDYAHSRGVIHRDIKPSNIMFDNQGSAYLVDFGIAKLLGETHAVTTTGAMLGTPNFMPPEQWVADDLTPAADQYSLGVVVYTLLTGSMPFQATTPYALMHKHIYERPTPPHLHRPDIPEAVTRVLERALAKQPEDRFPNCTSFAQAFEGAVQGSTGEKSAYFTAPVQHTPPATRLLTGTPPAPVTAARPAYKSPLVWIMSLVILLLGAALVFLLVRGGDEDRITPTAPAAAQNVSDTPDHTNTPELAAVVLPGETPASPTADPPTPTSTLPPVSLPLVETFDSRPQDWLAGGAWVFDTQTAHSGAGWFVGSLQRGQTSILAYGPQIDLRTDRPIELTFWQKANLSTADVLTFDLSTNDGAAWITLDQRSGPVEDWTLRTLDLTSYQNQLVRLRFRLDTAGDLPAGEITLGAWIDDLAIRIIPPEPSATSAPALVPAPTRPWIPTYTEMPSLTPVDTTAPTETPTEGVIATPDHSSILGETPTHTETPTPTLTETPTPTETPTVPPPDTPTAESITDPVPEATESAAE